MGGVVYPLSSILYPRRQTWLRCPAHRRALRQVDFNNQRQMIGTQIRPGSKFPDVQIVAVKCVINGPPEPLGNRAMAMVCDEQPKFTLHIRQSAMTQHSLVSGRPGAGVEV